MFSVVVRHRTHNGVGRHCFYSRITAPTPLFLPGTANPPTPVPSRPVPPPPPPSPRTSTQCLGGAPPHPPPHTSYTCVWWEENSLFSLPPCSFSSSSSIFRLPRLPAPPLPPCLWSSRPHHQQSSLPSPRDRHPAVTFPPPTCLGPCHLTA